MNFQGRSNLNLSYPLFRTVLLLVLCPILLMAQGNEAHEIEPVEYIYNTIDSIDLKAFVFSPQIDEGKVPLPAIVIFHGGGWTIGEPTWAFGRARHFASKGIVAVAAQYRLSNQIDITPIEAMQDARTVIRWMRSNADSFFIDVNSIAAYGWSAGAHLAVSVAIFEDSPDSSKQVSCIPDALILVSPAVSLTNDA